MNPAVSTSHLVLIPSYNPGELVYDTVREARKYWAPVWVVVDGSTDGTAEGLQQMAQADPGLHVLVLDHNQGKGAAVLHGLRAAVQAGYTHVLTMDSDGQHPAAKIPEFMAASLGDVNALVLGRPVFDDSAPMVRVLGRRISNWWANLETLWQGIGDSLYGFRVYPAQMLIAVMESSRWMRRFDFDPEVAVRMCWRGARPVNIAAPVKYLTAGEGGVSHFKYLRDNVLLIGMHVRLFTGFVLRLPRLVWRKLF
jgi:glycosyltransferase involved in cell wall biosynthesis